MAALAQRGPYTIEELLAFWKTIVDPLYAEAFLEQGEGNGLEVFTQAMAQLVRVSEAIDRTTQAMFILPWSGQTDVPAEGGSHAVVTLRLERTKLLERTLVLTAGAIFAEEVTTDYAENQGIEVVTGRRYVLRRTLVFLPGERGPFEVEAVAEREGYGYNNPLSGTIQRLDQPGSDFQNDKANVVPGTAVHRLEMQAEPDVLMFLQIGQYVQFTSGGNAGRTERIVGYEAPNPSAPPPNGGAALLEKLSVVRVTGAAGTFIQGETVKGSVSGAEARLLKQAGAYLAADQATAPFVATDVVTGLTSLATAPVDVVEQDSTITAELGSTAAWRVLAWPEDWGLTVTNPDSPAGGRTAMLDELGNERGISRAPGEADDSYRARVAQLPDTVSPNAIRRAGNRILAPLGLSVCLREVGSALLPGAYCDAVVAPPDPALFYAYDLDIVRFLTGPITGVFFEGEVARQVDGGTGQIATGHVTFRHLPLGVPPFSEGPPLFDGLSGVHGTFKPGLPVVGERSGATFTPATVSGGLQARDRFKLWLDYAEFRAFFLVQVPPINLGEFGAFFDAGPFGFFDIPPFLAFFDGFPVTGALFLRNVWQAINAIRAGGVGFDVVVSAGPCV